MLLVPRNQVGEAAFARLLREGIVAPYGPALGRPRDVPDTPGMRAHAASLVLRPGHAVTGLGALWIRELCPAPPTEWHVLAGLGSRDKGRPGRVRHASAAAGDVIGPALVATPARACVDALRWERIDLALTATLACLGQGSVAPMELEAAAQHAARGPEGRRMRALAAAVIEAADAAQDIRLAPVTRRAS